MIAAGIGGAGGSSGGVAVAAPAARRYSGTVRAVDLEAAVVVVEELGRGGQPERHEVRFGPDTRIVSSARLRPHQMRGTGAYGEVPVSPADLLVGDYVTIESHEEGGRGVATRITIVEIPGRSGANP